MPTTLSRDISPPPRLSKRRKTSEAPSLGGKQNDTTSLPTFGPTPAAVEAGEARVEDHLAYFKEHLSKAVREKENGVPRISIEDWAYLYQSNVQEHGNHFVIHQHNHPVSGVHYDLRLQFSKSSSMSFAVPKGLPGNPNSKSLGRMAIETRVHNFWNHLIETASPKTGSLLIWDTGTYTILSRKNASKQPPSPQTTDEESDPEPGQVATALPQRSDNKPENEKLIHAFQTRYIRLCLHGVRLPNNYTITFRLPDTNNFGRPHPLPARRKFWRRRWFKPQPRDSHPNSTDDSEAEDQPEQPTADIDTDSEEDAQTRLHNAYPGSTNSIGSVHQRQWFILLDRSSSGFVLDKGTGLWVRGGRQGEGEGFEKFFVRGRNVERSVVTGRLAREVESDEGVEGFVGRGGWMGIER